MNDIVPSHSYFLIGKILSLPNAIKEIRAEPLTKWGFLDPLSVELVEHVSIVSGRIYTSIIA